MTVRYMSLQSRIHCQMICMIQLFDSQHFWQVTSTHWTSRSGSRLRRFTQLCFTNWHLLTYLQKFLLCQAIVQSCNYSIIALPVVTIQNKKAQLTLTNQRDDEACKNCSNSTCFVSFHRIPFCQISNYWCMASCD